jgi:hypothetical protein
VANALVRNDPPSSTLKAVLWMNAAAHLLSTVVDLNGVRDGVLTFGAVGPGLVAHALILLGALYYIFTMEDA